MSASNEKVWQTTVLQNLGRHPPSGTYFARFRVGGKLVWKSFENRNVFSREATIARHSARSPLEDRITIQYAVAMGLHVTAVDVGEEKLELARKLGARIAVDARAEDPASRTQDEIGGADGVLVTAVSPIAFKRFTAYEAYPIRRSGDNSRGIAQTLRLCTCSDAISVRRITHGSV